MVTFNRRRRAENTSGPGRIRRNEAEDNDNGNENDGETQDADAAGRPKWLVPAAVGGAVLAGALGAAFMFSGGNDETGPVAPPSVVTEPQTPAPPVVVETKPDVPGASSILAASIAAKNDVIYVDRANEMAEAYITTSGTEARSGEDFAVHVGMYELGGVSVLIAEGPYAGSRIGFFPEDTRSGGELRVTFERVGQIVEGPDGQTDQFVTLPASQAERYDVVLTEETEMGNWNGGVTRNSVSLSGNAREFEKQIRESDGNWYPAFWLHGSPQEDGIFTVELWNSDSYSVDLNSGDFSVSSGYLFDPQVDEKINLAFDFEVAGNPRHPDYQEYRAIRESKDCELDPHTRAWENCSILRAGDDFPQFVNGTFPTGP